MKTNRLTIIAAASAIALASCTGTPASKSNETTTTPTEVTAQDTTANFYGTYEGTLPAADGEGIRTTLTLNDDTTYRLVSEYLGTKEPTAETNGVYNLIGKDLVELITPSSGTKTYYKIIENGVALSDSLGTVNEGELAEFYKLKKK